MPGGSWPSGANRRLALSRCSRRRSTLGTATYPSRPPEGGAVTPSPRLAAGKPVATRNSAKVRILAREIIGPPPDCCPLRLTVYHERGASAPSSTQCARSRRTWYESTVTIPSHCCTLTPPPTTLSHTRR